MFYCSFFLFSLPCVVALCYAGCGEFLRKSRFAGAGSGPWTKIRSGGRYCGLSRSIEHCTGRSVCP